jgi:hypothetical protein
VQLGHGDQRAGRAIVAVLRGLVTLDVKEGIEALGDDLVRVVVTCW